MGSVGKSFKHADCIEVPNRRPTHDIQAKGTRDAKIEGSIELLHEARLLLSVFDPCLQSEWAEKLLHYKLAGEGQYHDIEGDKGEITSALAIHDRSSRETIAGALWVGKEERAVEWVARTRVEAIQREDDEHQYEWIDPCILEREALPASKESLGLAPF